MWNHRRPLLLFFVLTFALAAVLGASRSKSQTQPRPTQEFNDLPIVDYGSAHSEGARAGDTEDQTKRKAKGEKYNKKDPVVHPALVEISEIHHWPENFPALPIRDSDIVCTCYVEKAQAFLSNDETGVYSEFTVTIEEVLKDGTSEALASGRTITVEREGGRVRYPGGHVSRFSIVGLRMPRVGHRYLLFVKKEPNNYPIITGYELNDGRVIPLDESEHFARYKGWEQAALIEQIRAAMKAGSQSLSR